MTRAPRVAGVGVHVPRYRLPAAAAAEAWGSGPDVDRRAVPAADEDALTMAVAATRRALADAGLDAVGTVALATTTPPLAEGEALPRLGRMLGLPADLRTRTFTGSPAGAADALLAAADADGPAVAVAADCPRGDEPADGGYGAGAAAFVFADAGPAALVDRAEHVRDAPGVRLRERGEATVSSPDVTAYERSVVRAATAAALDGLDDGVAGTAAAALHQPDPRTPERAAAGTDLDGDAVRAGTVVGRLGDAGAATVPLGLLAGLSAAAADEAVVAVPFGGGSRATALRFRVERPLDAGVRAALDPEAGVEVSYARYLRERGYLGDAAVGGGGAHVSLPSWQRTLDGRYLRSAGRCPACGAVAFPPEGACPSCHERVDFEAVALPDEGVVEAVTVVGEGSAPPEFAALQRRSGAFAVALVSLSVDGERVRLPAMCTDCDPSAVGVGDRVRATVRRLYADAGVTRYAAKFVPA